MPATLRAAWHVQADRATGARHRIAGRTDMSWVNAGLAAPVNSFVDVRGVSAFASTCVVGHEGCEHIHDKDGVQNPVFSAGHDNRTPRCIVRDIRISKKKVNNKEEQQFNPWPGALARNTVAVLDGSVGISANGE